MAELKPCPFCGGEEVSIDGYRDVFFVQCDDCGATFPMFDTLEEAASAWNRRAQPENKPLTLDELRRMGGGPVWMAKAKAWAFVSTVSTEPYAQVWYFTAQGFANTVLYYHEKFYRQKPERSVGE